MMHVVKQEIQTVLDQLQNLQISRQEAEDQLLILSCLSNQAPIGKIFRATELNEGRTGDIILRSNEENLGIPDNEFWEEIGLAWSGPVGFGSMPEGFISTNFGIMVNLSDYITADIQENQIILGSGHHERFRGIVSLYYGNKEELESLSYTVKAALEEYKCSESGESQ